METIGALQGSSATHPSAFKISHFSYHKRAFLTHVIPAFCQRKAEKSGVNRSFLQLSENELNRMNRRHSALPDQAFPRPFIQEFRASDGICERVLFDVNSDGRADSSFVQVVAVRAIEHS